MMTTMQKHQGSHTVYVTQSILCIYIEKSASFFARSGLRNGGGISTMLIIRGYVTVDVMCIRSGSLHGTVAAKRMDFVLAESNQLTGCLFPQLLPLSADRDPKYLQHKAWSRCVHWAGTSEEKDCRTNESVSL